MTRTKLCIILVLPVVLILGFSQIVAQVAPAGSDLFEPVRTIGANRPSGLRYDPNFDQFVWVDPQGQLVIVDAATLNPLHVLYRSGAYAGFTFSRNGRLLAVAIDVRVDIWDTSSGALVASFEPPGARQVQGALQFTRNDELLVLDSIVPAPQELRRSENDTVILPWVWDIAAAREERNSVLVNRVEAYPFYNVRVSMIAGDNGVLISGLDNRIQVYDADTPTMELIGDFPTSRLETDPITAWRSATDPYLYINLTNYGEVVQINTLTNEMTTLELGRELDASGLERLQQLAFSRAEQPLGERTNQINPLAQLLLGGDYIDRQGYTASLFNLLDVLIPLTDDPQRNTASGTSLLVFNLNKRYGTATIDLLHPPEINQIALSPDRTRLAMRRQSGTIDLYTLATGALERIITPSEPDPEGRRPLAFTSDGETMIVDFERFDATTGERLMRAENYTQPFNTYLFTDENQLITFGGTTLADGDSNAQTWRLWDIESGKLLREDSMTLAGEATMEISPDFMRFLTQTLTPDGGATLYIIDRSANSTETVEIPALSSATVQSITANDDWTRFIVVYAKNDQSSGNAVAVYTRDGERLYFDAGNNLLANPFSYEWRDARTIVMRAYSGSRTRPPISGLTYHPSGLPQCVVDALPDSWQSLVPIWERLAYTGARSIDAITQQLCMALTGDGAQNVSAAEGTPSLPADATAITNYLLTPTPTVEYRSARTPAPIAVPGVPTCITSYFRSQAAAYADLWREITANVTDPQQLGEINDMICEGLIGDLGGLQPTPTINPNAMAITTPTPLPAAPETTGGDENRIDVMTVDVETGARTLASGVVQPGEPVQADALTLVSNFFNTQYRTFPTDPVLSPDGRYLATRTRDGFVMIYRLARPVSALMQDEQNAIATRMAQQPRSIGLAPTASPLPQSLNAALPTLTPTITLTPLPFTEAETPLPQWGETQFVCPASSLARLPELPAGFAPPGTLIVSPARQLGGVSFLWTLDPRTGKLTGDAERPQCGRSESCNLSPDGDWIVREGRDGDVVVSRIDGTDAMTLYRAPEVRLISPSFTWHEPHTLIIHYSGVLPTVSPQQIALSRTYDPETGAMTDGALAPTVVPLGLLPFDVLSRQPYGTLELLREQFSGGRRYYLRDTSNGEVQRFAQGELWHEWQPAGRFLYYGDYANAYAYDTLTAQHTRLGKFDEYPGGAWSPDGHLKATWIYSSDSQGAVEALMRGEQPPRLQVWNSDTGLTYTYCLPELGVWGTGVRLVWSPDSRYLAFTTSLPVGGDIAPTPTFAISPEAPPATSTPIPLETQYDYQFPRTIILDTTTGNAAIVSSEAGDILSWLGE